MGPFNRVTEQLFQVWDATLHISNICIGPITSHNYNVLFPAARLKKPVESYCNVHSMPRVWNDMAEINAVWFFNHDIVILNLVFLKVLATLALDSNQSCSLFSVKKNRAHR